MHYWHGTLLYKPLVKLNMALFYIHTSRPDLTHATSPNNNSHNVQILSTYSSSKEFLLLYIFWTVYCILRDPQLTDLSPELKNFFFLFINLAFQTVNNHVIGAEEVTLK